jgi:hypothetical protein
VAATDQDKSRPLLPHWIEHNTERATEFRLWAQKAQAASQEEVTEEIGTAAALFHLGR